MKLIVVIISVVVTLMMAVLGGFVLLITLNGFSEGQAALGLSIYPLISTITVILSGVMGARGFRRLTTSGKGFRRLVGVIAIAEAIVLSALMLVIAFALSIVITNASLSS